MSSQITVSVSANDVPAPLQEIPLAQLFITPGSLGKVHRAGVKTIGQFLAYPPVNLLHIKAIGVRTVNALMQEVDALRTHGDLRAYHFNGKPMPEDPKDFALYMLKKLDKDEYEVMVFRYGLGIPRKHTLAAIGEIKELSRERVRQRENKNLLYLFRVFGPYVSEYIEKLRSGKLPGQSGHATDPNNRYLDLIFAIEDSPNM